MPKPTTIDEYIAAAPEPTQAVLVALRDTVRAAVPGVEERISYGMPTCGVGGRAIVHLAAWKRHIGIYPVPVIDAALEQRLAAYRSTKDTLRFPLADPMPLALIAEVVTLLARQKGGVTT